MSKNNGDDGMMSTTKATRNIVKQTQIVDGVVEHAFRLANKMCNQK